MSHHFMANRWGKKWKQWQVLFSLAPKSLQMVTAATKFRRLLLGRKAVTNMYSVLKSSITLQQRSIYQSYVFSSSHLCMWELDHKEGWGLKNWCFQTVVLEKTVKNPLDSKEIKSVNLKGNQSWIFIGRIDPEVQTPVLWPPDAKCWHIGKDPVAGKIEVRRRGQQNMRSLNSMS